MYNIISKILVEASPCQILVNGVVCAVRDLKVTQSYQTDTQIPGTEKTTTSNTVIYA